MQEWYRHRQREKNGRSHDAIHDAFYHYMQELNRIYLNDPALWNDYTENGFEWLDCQLEKECIYSFFRRSDEKTLLAVFNFSDKETEYTMLLGDINNVELTPE